MKEYTPIAAFLKPILAGNWIDAGVLADWLEEHGDPRGVLLRRRWRMWQKERDKIRAAAEAREQQLTRPWRQIVADLVAGGATVEASHISARVTPDYSPADNSFRMYLRGKFSQECYEASDPEKSSAYTDA